MFGVVKGNRMDLADTADYEMHDSSALFSTGINLIPAPGTVQGTRHLYGNKFFEQALPLVHRESPLVKTLNNETQRSWDWEIGKHLGVVRASDEDENAVVEKVDPDEIVIKRADGRKIAYDLYNHFPGNRKTSTVSYAKVKKGDVIKKGQTLAPNNFTDDEGRMALGLNARIGLVPYKGYSMDDAIVISRGLAERLRSMHAEAIDREADDELKLGKNHYISLFPKSFKQEQLEKLDDEGLPLVGSTIEPGDPLVLQTRPRSFSSNKIDLSRLSRAQRFVRKDAALKWEGKHPATVVAVAKTKEGGHKIMLEYTAPVETGDKLSLRPGQKSTVSKILEDEKMPRTEDGRPLEALLNPLSLPSRENAESFYEMMLGKIARKTGKPYALPQFLPKGQTWDKFVQDEMDKHGVTDAERVYDPEEDMFLDEPVTTGEVFLMKLHHQAGKKMTARGQKGYTIDLQPMKGKGQSAQRVSGLEMTVLQSSGGRGVQKEAILLRGEQRDDYWKQLRANRTPKALDKPFVWHKFLALLQGAGVNPREGEGGNIRLTPMTNKELELRDPVEIQNDGIVDLHSLEPKKGGLFDPDMVRDARWGFIKLRRPVVNPAYEDSVRVLLGLTKEQYEKLLDEEESV